MSDSGRREEEERFLTPFSDTSHHIICYVRSPASKPMLHLITRHHPIHNLFMIYLTFYYPSMYDRQIIINISDRTGFFLEDGRMEGTPLTINIYDDLYDLYDDL